MMTVAGTALVVMGNWLRGAPLHRAAPPRRITAVADAELKRPPDSPGSAGKRQKWEQLDSKLDDLKQRLSGADLSLFDAIKTDLDQLRPPQRQQAAAPPPPPPSKAAPLPPPPPRPKVEGAASPVRTPTRTPKRRVVVQDGQKALALTPTTLGAVRLKSAANNSAAAAASPAQSPAPLSDARAKLRSAPARTPDHAHANGTPQTDLRRVALKRRAPGNE